MMSDMKKLFKSDSFYWLIAALIMLLLETYMVLNVLGRDLEEMRRGIELGWRVTDMTGRVIPWGIPSDAINTMMMGIVVAAFAAQTIKMLFQETKNRTEVLNLFPVKSRNRLTYHYISGLLIVGIPILIQMVVIKLNLLNFEKKMGIRLDGADYLWRCAAEAVITFMLYYSLLILCRKLTNHIAGTIFTFVIVNVLAYDCFIIYYNYIIRIPSWVSSAIIMAVMIILSYIAEQKKDYARNGFYAFPIVHWIIMGIVFIEVCYVSSRAYVDIPKVVSNLLTIVISLLITVGVHFLTRPKKI